jgi:SAM-dependent methyltransferase
MKRILVLGCGDYRLKSEGDLVYYVDNDPVVCASDSNVINMDLEKYPWYLPHSFYDYIIADGLLEHVSDIWNFMFECHQVLRPKGRMTALVPWWNNAMYWNDPDHVRGFSTDTMLNILDQTKRKFPSVNFSYTQQIKREFGGYHLRKFLKEGSLDRAVDFLSSFGRRSGIRYELQKM